MVVHYGYVALRRNEYDGRQWFDMETWAGRMSLTIARARYVERRTTGLRATDPVIGIQRVCVRPDGDMTKLTQDGRLPEKTKKEERANAKCVQA